MTFQDSLTLRGFTTVECVLGLDGSRVSLQADRPDQGDQVEEVDLLLFCLHALTGELPHSQQLVWKFCTILNWRESL